MPKTYTPDSAAQDVEAALRLLEGRWKLVILFHLFGGKILRFSDLERVIPNITQKMLGQQLRRMESDGIVVRKVYPQVPPKVEYSLTVWGQSLCPALDAFLKWADLRPQPSAEHLPELTANKRPGERMAKNKDDLSIKSSLGVQDQICLSKWLQRQRKK
jgi:DNA-binding HxlR family transcriptional regulator